MNLAIPITIPQNIRSIGDLAFSNCSALSDFVIRTPQRIQLSNNYIQGCHNLRVVITQHGEMVGDPLHKVDVVVITHPPQEYSLSAIQPMFPNGRILVDTPAAQLIACRARYWCNNRHVTCSNNERAWIYTFLLIIQRKEDTYGFTLPLELIQIILTNVRWMDMIQ